MRLLLDTNVLIAAFISRGTCHELLAHCIYNHAPVISRALLREFQQKLITKFHYSQKDARAAASLIASRFEIVTAAALARPVSRDPDDDAVVATAVAGGCRCIVTGDKDLLVLKRYEEIEILSPAEFWKYEVGQGAG
jgi:uncharacterized protein